MWLACAATDLEELNRLNLAHSDRQIAPAPSADGQLLVSAELLGDEYWVDYWGWLAGLTATDIAPEGVLGMIPLAENADSDTEL